METNRDIEDLKGDLRKVNNIQNGYEQRKWGFSREVAILILFFKARGEARSVLDSKHVIGSTSYPDMFGVQNTLSPSPSLEKMHQDCHLL